VRGTISGLEAGAGSGSATGDAVVKNGSRSATAKTLARMVGCVAGSVGVDGSLDHSAKGLYKVPV
jgi:hypothetical protein